MQLSKDEMKNRYLKQLYAPSCDHKNKEVYVLKSTTKFKNWWYDHRISYVDTRSFADYRTEYFKDGKKIKLIDRNWASMDIEDPRGVYWLYWYGKDLQSNQESMINIPEKYVIWNNPESDADLWTEEALQQLRN